MTVVYTTDNGWDTSAVVTMDEVTFDASMTLLWHANGVDCDTVPPAPGHGDEVFTFSTTPTSVEWCKRVVVQQEGCALPLFTATITFPTDIRLMVDGIDFSYYDCWRFYHNFINPIALRAKNKMTVLTKVLGSSDLAWYAYRVSR